MCCMLIASLLMVISLDYLLFTTNPCVVTRCFLIGFYHYILMKFVIKAESACNTPIAIKLHEKEILRLVKKKKQKQMHGVEGKLHVIPSYHGLGKKVMSKLNTLNYEYY
uniref:Uncharacterized protein n=1 Tax=Cacopsylla melanoneura TaxID=428564 RepID=A0A8D8RJK6_9HEMI